MTTETEHTPERWQFNAFGSRGGDGPSHFRIWAGDITNGGAIANTVAYGRTDEANARRIVACVNACKGIATETLEKGSLNRDAADMLAIATSMADRLAEAERLLRGLRVRLRLRDLVWRKGVTANFDYGTEINAFLEEE